MDLAESQAVFVSYASEDLDAARRIAEALRAAGLEVWLDQDELRGGDRWEEKIRRQIKECAVFVPIISRHTQSRPEGYFRLEWRLADQRTHRMGRSRAFIVPACIDDLDTDEPDVPDSFNSVQWVRVGGDEAGLRQLVSCIRMQLGGGASAPVFRPRAALGTRSPSVAVLAFANLTGGGENDYFSDGISEELLNVLAKVPGLSVTARTSSFFFKGKNVPIPEIGRRLGVAFVLEGSVRRARGRIRINAQLIDAATGFHIWSEGFDRELADVFALQDEIAAHIARKLELTIAPQPGRGAADPEVHRLVLQGRQLWNEFTDEAFAQAEVLFNAALRLAPDCAAASAGLANVCCRRAILTAAASRHIEDLLGRAEAQARSALASDATLAEPRAVLGTVAHMRGHLVEAERHFQDALDLNPNSDLTLVYRARLMECAGRPDLAVSELEHAYRLSPLVGAWAGHRATALLGCRRHSAVVELATSMERIFAGSRWTGALCALALAKLGRSAEATSMIDSVVSPASADSWLKGLNALVQALTAWAAFTIGEHVRCRQIADALAQGPEPLRYAAGIPLALLGDGEAAFAMLKDMPQWFVDYVLILGDQHEAIGTDPRFLELLRSLGAERAFHALQSSVRSEGSSGGFAP